MGWWGGGADGLPASTLEYLVFLAGGMGSHLPFLLGFPPLWPLEHSCPVSGPTHKAIR